MASNADGYKWKLQENGRLELEPYGVPNLKLYKFECKYLFLL
jgi:hypothetical protein